MGSTCALIDLTLDAVTKNVSSDAEDVLAHLDEEPELFADEESLCGDEQLEWLAIEFDARVAGSKWEGENKRKSDSLVADLEVAPGSKRCRTAKSHAETMKSTTDGQFARLGQATARMLKRK